ncbi:hypothetical protein ABT352_33180 [Streptosporangium sp. NPDC000563]|uniref:hypothetical protein n=1 Tax=Streptosporangium sp. NPDC000563 TaxID=3154366 RepID=UPI003326ADFB
MTQPTLHPHERPPMTFPAIGATYVLVHDGLWMYYLPETLKPAYGAKGDITAHADGQLMTKLLQPGWWGSAHQAEQITIHVPQRDRVIGYRLDDPATESERFPATLTTEKYDELREQNDIWFQMYSPLYQSVTAQALSLTGPWTVLENAAPAPVGDPRPWHASLPTILTQRPEYAHLFPGALSGFRDHLRKLIEAMPYVRHVFTRDEFEVVLEVPLELPEHQWVPSPYPARRRRGEGHNRQVTITRRLHLPIPDRVPGVTRADAERVWDEQTAHWTAVVTSASAKACNTCRGTGHVVDGSTEYDAKKA